ncbi:MAG: hypothetical protein QGI32_22880 [Candidatus Latescibacteria bacterium]|jgi:hypothetical protein|nr:hypothetical protein [Candidatus Latescibacterota bacterium]
MRRQRWLVHLLACCCLQAVTAGAQEHSARLGDIKRGGRVSFEPTGPGVLFDALDPVVRKWYIPQELFAEYGWRQREYANYARDNYQRYVSTAREGNYFYDVYGNFLTRGWLILDWRQQNPQPFGSTLFKDGRFGGWFNNVVVASDHKGQYHYAITFGNEIRTTLTPMTFSKPNFNGVQLDFASDKHQATVIMSRISEPNFFVGVSSEFQEARTNNTNLMGGRVVVQLGDFVKLGGTLVNAHHAYTQSEAFSGNILQGNLTGIQRTGNVQRIEVRIRDDSPEDGEAGGALFASDIVITDLEGNQVRGSEIGFRPVIEGGFQQGGFLAADGFEVINLSFDFLDRTYSGPDPSDIRRVQLELVLANDYLVEVVSDRQVNFRSSRVFLPVARATGNVKDSSNQRVLAFDYGLPTANQIAGMTLELTDLAGLDGYLEMDRNTRSQQYPNRNLDEHAISSVHADALLLNLSKVADPFFAHLEAFDVDADYTTNFTTVDNNNIVDYGRSSQTYEFVDDNDDQDRLPDWSRKGRTTEDFEVFPGWDENNDFVSDFNQNDSDVSPNLIPDYEEPFLRFHVDRPEFLYGVDMNHNGWIDRFENDQSADYPYKPDRRGYNLYAGANVTPDLRLSAGRLRMEQITDDRQNDADYLLVTYDGRWPTLRLKLFQDLSKVRDNISDNLVQWLQPPNSAGELIPVTDPLPAPDTWVNTTWIGAQLKWRWDLRLHTTLKWQLFHQLLDDDELFLSGLRDRSSFLGHITRVDAPLQLWRVALTPGLKTEYRNQVPSRRDASRREEFSRILMLIGRLPVMRQSHLEIGVERHVFSQLRSPTPPGAEDSFGETTTIVQLSNASDYQGYRLTTQLGFDVTRRHFEVEGTRTRTRGFIVVYAGVSR